MALRGQYWKRVTLSSLCVLGIMLSREAVSPHRLAQAAWGSRLSCRFVSDWLYLIFSAMHKLRVHASVWQSNTFSTWKFTSKEFWREHGSFLPSIYLASFTSIHWITCFHCPTCEQRSKWHRKDRKWKVVRKSNCSNAFYMSSLCVFSKINPLGVENNSTFVGIGPKIAGRFCIEEMKYVWRWVKWE